MHLIPIIQACATRQQPFTLRDAEVFLEGLDSDTQRRLISALYMGRNALYQDTFTDDDAPWATADGLLNSPAALDPAHFADTLSSKGMSTITYFQRFLICAKNAGLNI